MGVKAFVCRPCQGIRSVGTSRFPTASHRGSATVHLRERESPEMHGFIFSKVSPEAFAHLPEDLKKALLHSRGYLISTLYT